MPEVLALLTGPALFWLDAGYYGWVGKQGDQQRLVGGTGNDSEPSLSRT